MGSTRRSAQTVRGTRSGVHAKSQGVAHLGLGAKVVSRSSPGDVPTKRSAQPSPAKVSRNVGGLQALKEKTPRRALGTSLEQSDEALMALYQGGDSGAFEVLFTRYRRQLFTFLLHHVGDLPAAEDVFQDVFLKLVRSASQFDGKRSFRGWLYAIARNTTTDRQRRLGVRGAEILESAMGSDSNESGLDGVVESGVSSVDPAREAEGSEFFERIQGALLKLPDSQREVFLLRERAELDYERIAELTGCGVATAKSRMRYALVALRRHLLESGFDPLAAAGGPHE
mgnify:CR=1 FL=1|jgi:RNA polymerase sigma-70 factor, ECF subfamily